MRADGAGSPVRMMKTFYKQIEVMVANITDRAKRHTESFTLKW